MLFSRLSTHGFPLLLIICLYWGKRGNRGVLDIPDAELEILYRQTVLTRAIDRKSASRFAENARTEGRSEGYEQARLELSQSKSLKIGGGNNGYSQKDVGR